MYSITAWTRRKRETRIYDMWSCNACVKPIATSSDISSSRTAFTDQSLKEYRDTDIKDLQVFAEYSRLKLISFAKQSKFKLVKIWRVCLWQFCSNYKIQLLNYYAITDDFTQLMLYAWIHSIQTKQWLSYKIYCETTQLSSVFRIKFFFLIEVPSQDKDKQTQYNFFTFACPTGNWTRDHSTLCYYVPYDLRGLYDVCHSGIIFRPIF